MTASELRVGNWVKCKTTDGYKFGKICDILDIGYFAARCDGVEYRGKFGNIGADIESVEPIELTRELLLKLDYRTYSKYDDEGIYHHDYLCDLTNEDDGYYLYDCNECQKVGRKIEGLHHLQNLIFDLQGKELNIEL